MLWNTPIVRRGLCQVPNVCSARVSLGREAHRIDESVNQLVGFDAIAVSRTDYLSRFTNHTGDVY